MPKKYLFFPSFLGLSKSNRVAGSRILLLLIALSLFLIPNLVFLFPNLFGTYLIYLTWCIVAVLAALLVGHRGLGILSIRDAINIGLTLVVLLMFLGLPLGFYYKMISVESLLVNAMLLAIKISAAEVARASVMVLVSSRRFLKLVAGSIAGLLFGYTFSSNRLIDLLIPYGGLLTISNSVPQIIYSILVTEIHILGGLYPALVFRLVLDGFWRLSPYTPSLSSLGAVSSVALSLVYIFAMVIMPSYDKIKGSSKSIFRSSSIRRAASVAADITVFAVIILLSYSLYAGIIPLVIISGSMEPALGIGDIALILRIRNPSEVNIGDVIAFWYEKQVLIHRVINITGDGFVTKGDAVSSPDPFEVKTNHLIGRVVGSIPKIGWVAIILRSTPEGLSNIAHRIYENMHDYLTLLLVILVLIAFMLPVVYKLNYKINKIY
ncbi:MAG: signal peptidase I [Sulfolobales archaeon]